MNWFVNKSWFSPDASSRPNLIKGYKLQCFSRGQGKAKAFKGAIHVMKIRFLWIRECIVNQESAPFSYTCHNCDVPDCMVLWRISSVLVHVSQLRWSIMFWTRVCVRVSSAVYLLCFLNVWRIGSVLVHVWQLSIFRVSDIWRIGSVLVHVSQVLNVRVCCNWRIGSVLVQVC